MMNENNDVFTMEDEPIASVVQDMRKGSKWLSAFLESYRPPLDGERYLTDGEVAELLRVSRRTLQEYRNNRVLPFILLGFRNLRDPLPFCIIPYLSREYYSRFVQDSNVSVGAVAGADQCLESFAY